MSTEAATAIQIERSINWLDANRDKLVKIAAAIAVVALVVSFYDWNRGQQEEKASAALSDVTPGANAADAYLKVANDYPKTTAAPRALLLAAGELFAAGKYSEAQTQFERLLSDFPESSFRLQASLGVAASLDAQGKAADAMLRYDEVIKRFPNEAGVAQAKSSLARLYEAQNKPELALALYDDLQKTEVYTSFGLEANIRRMNLLSQHPELAAKTKAAVPAAK